MRKRLVSLLFAAVLMLSLLCMPAYAVGVLPQPDEYYYGDSYILPDYGPRPVGHDKLSAIFYKGSDLLLKAITEHIAHWHCQKFISLQTLCHIDQVYI